MSKYDKELQSNSDEYDEAVEPLEKDAERKHEQRNGGVARNEPAIGPDDETLRLPR